MTPIETATALLSTSEDCSRLAEELSRIADSDWLEEKAEELDELADKLREMAAVLERAEMAAVSRRHGPAESDKGES